mgnify:FL=1
MKAIVFEKELLLSEFSILCLLHVQSHIGSATILYLLLCFAGVRFESFALLNKPEKNNAHKTPSIIPTIIDDICWVRFFFIIAANTSKLGLLLENTIIIKCLILSNSVH